MWEINKKKLWTIHVYCGNVWVSSKKIPFSNQIIGAIKEHFVGVFILCYDYLHNLTDSNAYLDALWYY